MILSQRGVAEGAEENVDASGREARAARRSRSAGSLSRKVLLHQASAREFRRVRYRTHIGSSHLAREQPDRMEECES